MTATTPRHTSESLAAEFMARGNEFGVVRLTKKQGAWLYSLTMNENRDAGRGFGWSSHGGFRMVEGNGWKLVQDYNGSWTLGPQTY